MPLDYRSSNHMTHQKTDSSKSKIDQWYLIVFFLRKIIYVKMRYEMHD